MSFSFYCLIFVFIEFPLYYEWPPVTLRFPFPLSVCVKQPPRTFGFCPNLGSLVYPGPTPFPVWELVFFGFFMSSRERRIFLRGPFMVFTEFPFFLTVFFF